MFHLLHRNPETAKKRTVTDRHLFIFILLMVALMVIILLLYLVVDQGARIIHQNTLGYVVYIIRVLGMCNIYL